jgi:hypothetical protein
MTLLDDAHATPPRRRGPPDWFDRLPVGTQQEIREFCAAKRRRELRHSWLHLAEILRDHYRLRASLSAIRQKLKQLEAPCQS